ncbi:hypothetical protein JMF97_04455 [Micromonospora fiedleri]|uniref:Uncharacterized protein n=1 Tax=Micromonospora fiedleri TaxID=1157498 RepID=A0ABS1UKI3_9ACTN|nr:hypothetical protein [Micromonospora fiedleri]MBL6275410.1 hypothetical protein [Micromonospora fiedleri]
MTSRYSDADFQLVWPRTVFKAQAAKLLNQRARDNWNESVELLLEHAFAGGHKGGPAAEFRNTADSDHIWGNPPSKASSLTARQQFLRNLLSNADHLREDGPWRRPYWRERKAGQYHSIALSETAVIREFVRLVNELDNAGYFENKFGKDCVDDPRDDEPDALFERELGVERVWPLNQATLVEDIDLFFDIVELLHDHASLPTTRWLHNYAGCGWHHMTFEADPGRIVYRWRVNKILAQSAFDLRLADDGEDVGRLVSVTDDARTELMHAVASREDGGPSDQVRHAIALFRQRGADRNQKRSAIAALALVLEERRHNVLTDALAKSDRGALFDIANNFHVRHQDAKQKREYDDFYLDWIFWTYLATVELTNRIVDSQSP